MERGTYSTVTAAATRRRGRRRAGARRRRRRRSFTRRGRWLGGRALGLLLRLLFRLLLRVLLIVLIIRNVVLVATIGSIWVRSIVLGILRTVVGCCVACTGASCRRCLTGRTLH